MHFSLKNIDMNLLLVFDALYRHGSVSTAASALALSPSAFSHALNRLRDSLDDPLFLRVGRKMVPTARAENMAAGISMALGRLSVCLNEHNEFDPGTSGVCFTFATTDYTSAAIMPELIARINAIAPGITLKLVYSKGAEADEDLLSRSVDFVIGYEEESKTRHRSIEAITCFTDDYAVAARKGNPLTRAGLSREDYLNAGHVVVRPWQEHFGGIDRYLETQQLSRRIVVELPSLMSAPLIVSRTDLLITLPRRGILSLFNMHNLDVFSPPVPTPGYTIKAYYNPALGYSPAHEWMKAQIAAMAI